MQVNRSLTSLNLTFINIVTGDGVGVAAAAAAILEALRVATDIGGGRSH